MAKEIKKLSKNTEYAVMGGEPKSMILDKLGTITAYNFYNYFHQYDDAIDFLKAWIQSNRPELLKKLKIADKFAIPQNVGWIAKLKSNGCTMPDDTQNYFEKKLKEISEFKEIKLETTKTKIKTYENLNIIRLEKIPDDILNEKEYVFNAHDHFKIHNVNLTDLKLVQDYYFGLKEQLSSKENKEYFSHSKSITINLIKFYSDIQNTTALLLNNRKREKTPRKIKPVSASKKVMLLKFMKESPTLKITSLVAEKILTSTEIYVYNDKNEKLTYLVAEEGKKFGTHRSAITNIDLTKSFTKKIRSPEKNIQKFTTGTKLAMRKTFEETKSIASPIEGFLTNANCILLRVF